jgi:glycosyltransferase involved in cell wall biosynthesis
VLGEESGYAEGHRVVFKRPRTVDYRASVHDIANYLMDLMTNESLRLTMGKKARERVVSQFDYRVVARRFVNILQKKLGLT